MIASATSVSLLEALMVDAWGSVMVPGLSREYNQQVT